MHTVEYYSAIKKNKLLPFATTWMDLEGIALSEVSQRKTNTVISLMCGSTGFNHLSQLVALLDDTLLVLLKNKRTLILDNL